MQIMLKTHVPLQNLKFESKSVRKGYFDTEFYIWTNINVKISSIKKSWKIILSKQIGTKSSKMFKIIPNLENW